MTVRSVVRARAGFTSIALLALALAPSPASAATYVVKPDGTGDFATIQDAVDAAGSGDEILLADGTFVGPGNRDVDYLGKAITIRSLSGVQSACVIDCEDADASGFRFRSGEGNASVLADLTVTRAVNTSWAVEARSSSPTLSNVALTDAGRTAIYAELGAPVITGCLFEANTGATSFSYGIHLRDAVATIEDCTFRANELEACVQAWGGATTIRRCDFDGNVGQGISVWRVWDNLSDPDATIEDCTVTNNNGGIYLSGDGTFTVRGCTITGNASVNGVSVGSSGTTPITVQNCEISGNTGSGLLVSGTAGGTIADCELMQNGGDGLSANGGTGSLTIDNCDIQMNGASGASLQWQSAASPLVMRDCTASGNGSRGIEAGGNPTIERCTVQGNTAAAIVLSGCNGATVRECLVTGNGRGLSVNSSLMVTVEDCTVASNHAAFSGGAMQIITSGVTVMRSILWGNCSDADGYEIWQTSSSSVQLTCTIVETARLHVFGTGTFTLTDVLEQDPLFCSPEACYSAPSTGGLYGLSPDSPALGQPCGPMGAPQPLCTAVGVGQSLEPASWGTVKAKYRE